MSPTSVVLGQIPSENPVGGSPEPGGPGVLVFRERRVAVADDRINSRIHALERTVLQLMRTLRELEEDNAHLRLSAQAFGELAERLNAVLVAERRRTARPAPTG